MTTEAVTLAYFLLARLDADEAVAHVCGEPPRVLAQVAAHRAILALVEGWRHEVCEDGWYTCAAATEDRDGGECIDDARRDGGCDCGRDSKANSILRALATIYADHPDYRDEWKP